METTVVQPRLRHYKRERGGDWKTTETGGKRKHEAMLWLIATMWIQE